MTATVAVRALVLPMLLLTLPAASGAAAGADDEEVKVIAAPEARNHIDQTCTAEMTVRSSKNAAPRGEYYLDSEEDFRDAMADGSVRFLKDSISMTVYRGLGTRAGGEVIDASAY